LAQDSSLAGFWDTRYRSGFTPWDAGGVPASLRRWLDGNPGRRSVLVPGCGTGYEVRAFHEHGHAVRGLDFSVAAVDAAHRELGALAGLVEQGDFFAVEGQWDLVYERALMCALPRGQWPSWAAKVATLVRPGGLLAGLFYFDGNAKGPPFGTDQGTLEGLLLPLFAMRQSQAVAPAESLPVFAGKERWQVWERRL
jgi:SAM-dependent methyltransferase